MVDRSAVDDLQPMIPSIGILFIASVMVLEITKVCFSIFRSPRASVSVTWKPVAPSGSENGSESGPVENMLFASVPGSAK